MATWHGYFGVEDIALNDQQRATLIAGLKLLGPNQHFHIAYRNHRRVRLDGEAVIFEAKFQDNVLDPDWWAARLAGLFNVAVADIKYQLNSYNFSSNPYAKTVVGTFSYNSLDYLRLALFGGKTAPTGPDDVPIDNWAVSGDEVRAYLFLNKAQWEGEGNE